MLLHWLAKCNAAGAQLALGRPIALGVAVGVSVCIVCDVYA